MANNKDISSTIKRTIQEADAPAIFFISDFAEFGYEYVRKVLSTLVTQGSLIRLANGIYIKPKMTKFGPLHPSTDAVVKAIAAHDSANILPTGAAAENMLGLSTQVPMNVVYLTDSSSRILHIGKQTIKFKRVVPKTFSIANRSLAILCLAMKSIGEKNLTEEHMGRINEIISTEMKKDGFAKDVQQMPLWIQSIIKTIIRNNK